MKKFRLNVTDCDWTLEKSGSELSLTLDNPQFEVSELLGGYAILGYDYLVVDHATNKAVRVDVNLAPLRDKIAPVLEAAKMHVVDKANAEEDCCGEVLETFARSHNCDFAEFSIVKM